MTPAGGEAPREVVLCLPCVRLFDEAIAFLAMADTVEELEARGFELEQACLARALTAEATQRELAEAAQ